jgi:hypothetical protein
MLPPLRIKARAARYIRKKFRPAELAPAPPTSPSRQQVMWVHLRLHNATMRQNRLCFSGPLCWSQNICQFYVPFRSSIADVNVVARSNHSSQNRIFIRCSVSVRVQGRVQFEEMINKVHQIRRRSNQQHLTANSTLPGLNVEHRGRILMWSRNQNEDRRH